MCCVCADKEKPSSCVLSISEAMHYYPMKDVLSATNLVSEYQPALIEEYLSYLTPQNLRSVRHSLANTASDQTLNLHSLDLRRLAHKVISLPKLCSNRMNALR